MRLLICSVKGNDVIAQKKKGGPDLVEGCTVLGVGGAVHRILHSTGLSVVL